MLKKVFNLIRKYLADTADRWIDSQKQGVKPFFDEMTRKAKFVKTRKKRFDNWVDTK